MTSRIWNLFESPESGNYARLVSLISVTAIITSTTIFCLETLPSYKTPDGLKCTDICRKYLYGTVGNISKTEIKTKQNLEEITDRCECHVSN